MTTIAHLRVTQRITGSNERARSSRRTGFKDTFFHSRNFVIMKKCKSFTRTNTLSSAPVKLWALFTIWAAW